MKYYCVFRDEQHYDFIMRQLSSEGFDEAKYTYDNILNSYNHHNKPCIVWYDHEKFLEYCNKEWCDREGYTEKKLGALVPEELFAL